MGTLKQCQIVVCKLKSVLVCINFMHHDASMAKCDNVYRSRGPFLERSGNLTGPKSYFEIKFSRKVGCVLTPNEVHFVSFADNLTLQFSNLLKLLSRMKNKTAY